MVLVTGALTGRPSSWRGIVGTPKSGWERNVPLTARLKVGLKAHRHLKSELVFCHADGEPFTQSAIEAALRFGCKRAGFEASGRMCSDIPFVLTSRCEPSVGAARASPCCPTRHLRFESLTLAPAEVQGARRSSFCFAEREGFEPRYGWGCPHRPVLGPSGLRASCLPQIPCSAFGLRAEWGRPSRAALRQFVTLEE